MSTAVGFDVKRFLADVAAFRERQGISTTQLAYRADVHPSSLKTMLGELQRRSSLSLGIASRLAVCADLSLDSYINWSDPERPA